MPFCAFIAKPAKVLFASKLLDMIRLVDDAAPSMRPLRPESALPTNWLSRMLSDTSPEEVAFPAKNSKPDDGLTAPPLLLNVLSEIFAVCVPPLIDAINAPPAPLLLN